MWPVTMTTKNHSQQSLLLKMRDTQHMLAVKWLVVSLFGTDKATPLSPRGVCRHSHGHCKHCRATSNSPTKRVMSDFSEKRKVSKHECLHCNHWSLTTESVWQTNLSSSNHFNLWVGNNSWSSNSNQASIVIALFASALRAFLPNGLIKSKVNFFTQLLSYTVPILSL